MKSVKELKETEAQLEKRLSNARKQRKAAEKKELKRKHFIFAEAISRAGKEDFKMITVHDLLDRYVDDEKDRVLLGFSKPEEKK